MCALCLLLAILVLTLWRLSKKEPLILPPLAYSPVADDLSELDDYSRDRLEDWTEEIEAAGFDRTGDFKGVLEGPTRRVDRVRTWVSSDRRICVTATFIELEQSRFSYLSAVSRHAGGELIATGRNQETLDAWIDRHRAGSPSALESGEPAAVLSELSALTHRKPKTSTLPWTSRLAWLLQLMWPFARMGKVESRWLDGALGLSAALVGATALLAWTPMTFGWTVAFEIGVALLATLVLRHPHPLLALHLLIAVEAVFWAAGRGEWRPGATAVFAGMVGLVMRFSRQKASEPTTPESSQRGASEPPATPPSQTATLSPPPPPPPAPLVGKPALPQPPRTENADWVRRHRTRAVYTVATLLCAPAGLLILGVQAYSLLERASFHRQSVPATALVTHSDSSGARFETDGARGQASAFELEGRHHAVGTEIEVRRSGAELRHVTLWSRRDWTPTLIGFALFIIPATSLALARRETAARRELWRSGIEARAWLVSANPEGECCVVRYQIKGRSEFETVTVTASQPAKPLAAPEDPSSIVVLVSPTDADISSPVLESDR